MNTKELFDKWNKKQKAADKTWNSLHMQYKLSTNKEQKRELQHGYLKFKRESQIIGQFMQDANLIQSD